MADTPTDTPPQKLAASDLTALAAGVTTLISTVSTLAVTGALQQMQRNHANYLFVAIGLVLAASAVWFALTLSKSGATATPPPTKPPSTPGPTLELPDWVTGLEARIENLLAGAETLHQKLEAMTRTAGAVKDDLAAPLHDGRKQHPAGPSRGSRLRAWAGARKRGLTELAALGLFLGGIATGAWGMIITQQAQDRPSVTASFDPKTSLLTVSATAHNLGSEGHMVTEVDGLTRSQAASTATATSTSASGSASGSASSEPDYAFNDDVRYLAFSGPDGGGTATEAFTTAIPPGYVAVSVSASTGDPNANSCAWDETLAARHKLPAAPVRHVVVPEHLQPGCVLIYLPPS